MQLESIKATVATVWVSAGVPQASQATCNHFLSGPFWLASSSFRRSHDVGGGITLAQTMSDSIQEALR